MISMALLELSYVCIAESAFAEFAEPRSRSKVDWQLSMRLERSV